MAVILTAELTIRVAPAKVVVHGIEVSRVVRKAFVAILADGPFHFLSGGPTSLSSGPTRTFLPVLRVIAFGIRTIDGALGRRVLGLG
ncbi:MAG: hypothetical protein Q3979_09450 [Actinomycetaceae bacterium]|nr:hypothetical protein [Actinomycetaceae bacterium]